MKAIPKISQFMTTVPHVIQAEATLSEALTIMEKTRVRHLPVMKSGKVYGLLSDRDLKSLFAFAGTDPKKIKVGDVCSDHPYTTQAQAPINEVAREMAENKHGSALVLDHEKLVGIFTATDACQALAVICETRFHQ